MEAENFLSYKSLCVNLENRGLILIAGNNWSGKTSLFDAFVWCLTGKTTRGVSGDEVINDKEKRDCFVRLRLNKNGSLFEVTRYQGHRKKKNKLEFKDVNGDIRGTHKADTQKRIFSVLGCDYELLLAITVKNQYDGSNEFTKLTDRDRKRILDSIIRTGRYEEAAKLVRSDISRLETHGKDLQIEEENTGSALELLDNQISTLVKSLGELNVADKSRLEDFRNRLEENVSTKNIIEKRLNKATRQLTQTSCDDLVEKRGSLKTTIHECLCGIQELKKREGYFFRHTRCKYCNQVITGKHKDAEIGSLEEQMSVLLEKHDSAEKELVKIDKAINKITELRSSLQNDIRKLKSKLSSLDHKREFLNNCLSTESQKLAQSEAQRNLILKQMESKRTQRKNLLEVLDSIKTELIKTSNKQKRLENVLFLLGSKGIPHVRYSMALPQINRGIVKALKLLGDGRIRAKLIPTVTRASGKEVNEIGLRVDGIGSYQRGSGAERSCIDVAVMLGLSELAANQASDEIGLMIFDESFRALDSTRHELVLEYLKEQAKRKTILVASHNDSFREMFPNVLIVENKDGFSYLQ